MKILIVDDEIEKAHVISKILRDAGVTADITHETTSVAARRRARVVKFDLLIIDLNLPDGIDDSPEIEGGIDFLDMLIVDPLVSLPADVFFITKREEDINSARQKVAERGAILWQFSLESEIWKKILLGRTKYLASRIQRTPKGQSVDIAIVTALQSPELDAVLDLDYNWHSKRFSNDPITYHFGSFNREGVVVKIVAVCAPRKGMPSASAISAKLANQFFPKYLVMTGICAGIPGKTNLGDVVVADPAWDYGSGKRIIDTNNSPVFQGAAYQMALDTDVRHVVQELARDSATTQSIRAGWSQSVPQGILSIRVAPMASGASVIADDQEARNVVIQHRDLAAIEMEGYAVMAAVESASNPKPIAIVIKSVCDFADTIKNDDWQSYAAYTSARFADKLFRSSGLKID
jgi:nucleoside phosphorylase